MGALTSRQNAGIEEVDVVSNQAYKYPARSGNYFGSHFIMGGERFDTPQPEAYLFGENADLNFLGSRPTPFPYPPPQANEPTKALKSVVNIRKESLRFVRCPDAINKGVDKSDAGCMSTQYNIEFTFDCDARCAITIYYFCTEEITANGVIYTPRDPSMNSETYHYKRGANQQFSQVSHVFNPSLYTDEELVFNPEHELVPIAIYCVAEEGPEEPKQSHTTIAVVDHHSDGTFVLKALKQKLFVDGLCYLVQEIYGIENKNIDNAKATGDEDAEDNGSECVICMSDVRDTLILPCRHLCLCNNCADSLRYQANNCPICRAPFRALLQIKTLQKCATSNGVTPASSIPGEGPCDHIPPGYEAVSLIEALNGPCTVRPVTVIAPQELAVPETPDQEENPQSAGCFTRTSLERTPKRNKHLGSPDECCDPPKAASWERNDRDKVDHRDSRSCPTPEYRMSVLLAREKEGMKLQTKSPLVVRHGVKPVNRDKSSLRHRDNVRLVNEMASLAAQASIASQDTDECPDEDSEAEKLSPLLDAATSTDPLPLDNASCNTLQSGTVDIEEVDDLLVEEQYNQRNVSSPVSVNHGRSHVRSSASGETETTLTVGGDDSDYYTPEDAPTSVIGPLHVDKQDRVLPPVSCSTVPSSVESTPGRWISSRDAAHLAGTALSGLTSLPGTPLSSASHFSNRSSNDSYSSSSSTRQLLTSADVATPNQERAVQL